mmetsp:Transcript_56177/g.114893  ORF Transcript_56177/g.114893 Transcript_56177/m.114893 type:complete len:163 (-) Transcript_56177:285-773(-)
MCGNPSDPFQVTSASVSPWPVKFSATSHIPLTIAIKGNLSIPVTKGTMELQVKKKLPYVDVWEKIPCIDDYGSCKYDLCLSLIHIFGRGSCDAWFLHNDIPCKCPLAPQSFDAPPSTLLLPATGLIPTWLADGDFQVQLTFKDDTGGPIGCFWLQISMYEIK